MNCKHSFVAYIDESGDEGFAFETRNGHKYGSSRWFVLSALVVRRQNDQKLVQLADGIRTAIDLPRRKPIHFVDIKLHNKKVKAVSLLSEAQARHITILVHKPSLREREKFSVKNRLYFYTGRFLLERISWLCRDNRYSKEEYDGSVLVVFSNRANTPYDEFKAYIEKILPDERSLAPGVIKPEQIMAIGHENRAGLQLVDLVASSYYASVEENFGVTEPRFALELKRNMYSRKGIKLNYGIKIIPPDGWGDIIIQKNWSWLKENFEK